MTSTDLQPTSTRRHARRRLSGRGRTYAAVLLLLLLAAALRLYNLRTSSELFIDEVTYTDIARSVARGDGVRLRDESFHLHPPALFLVLAGVMQALGLPIEVENLASLTYQMRFVPALFGSVTPAVVALVVRGATGRWLYALPAGAVLAIDPFLIRFDGRVLLEAQAMSFAALGLLGLVWLVKQQPDPRSWPWGAVPVGLLMFGSLITKETYAAVAVLPVLVLLATGLALPRRTAASVLGTTVAAYALYVIVLTANGELLAWFDSKTSGVQRLLGLAQVTGFNTTRESAGFTDRILANLMNFGVTYSVIGLGVLSTLWLLLLLRRGGTVPGCDRPVVVLVVVWALCAQAQLGYAVTLGTLEEQMFYLLVVTAVPVVSVAVAAVLDHSARARPPLLGWVSQRPAQILLSALLITAMTANAAVWWRTHTTRDDAYARFLDWAQGNLPTTSRVVATDETLQFILPARVIRLESGAETRAFRAQFVVVVTELVEQGYSDVDADLLDIVRQGSLVFQATGPTVGALQVYDVRTALDQAPR